MTKKPTKAATKAIAKARELRDTIARIEAEHPGAFDKAMVALLSGKDDDAELEAARAEMHTAVERLQKLAKLARMPEHRLKPSVLPRLRNAMEILKTVEGLHQTEGIPLTVAVLRPLTRVISTANNELLAAMKAGGGEKAQ